MDTPKWIERLQAKWNLKSAKQVVIVLIVFACTGTTVLLIKNPILNFFGISGMQGWLKNILYLVAVLPLYNVILLAYGALFGQFAFFWEFERKFVKRIYGLFQRKK